MFSRSLLAASFLDQTAKWTKTGQLANNSNLKRITLTKFCSTIDVR